MARLKHEVISFKVDRATLERLQAIPNRSEFIRAAVLQALDNACPLCGGTGVLTVPQKVHWDEFQRSHPLRECAECHEVRLVCSNAAPSSADRVHDERQGQ